MDILTFLFFSSHALASLEEAAGPRFYLVRDGQPACTLCGATETELQRRAVQAVVEGVREVSGVELPVEAGRGVTSPWVLVSGPEVWRLRLQSGDFGYFGDFGEEGFGFRQQGNALYLLARNDRAAYYGSVYLRDVLLRVEGRDVFLDAFPELVPPLRVRGTYHLACWGRSPEYRREDWQVVLNAMAEDGMNTVYFWLSGLFRSQRHPEAFTYPQTAMTTEDVRELIRYAHALGIKFYLGAGVFAWLGIDALAEAYPETKAVGSGGMCPSHPRARELNREYLLEMFDTFPEADGLFLEIRDEYGACQCARCQTLIPYPSSLIPDVRQYGQAELSFLEELSQAVWERKPTAELVWCVGYSEGGSHADDAGYYARLRELADPRRHWLVVRGNWELPDRDGKMHPLTDFAREMIHWTHYYEDSLEHLHGWIERSVKEGLMGYCPAFEPGFSSASFYSDDIPFPVEALPYVLTRFAYRTFTWEPHLSLEQFRERVRRKFFTPDAPPELTDDLLWLFDFIRTTATSGAIRPAGRWQHGERRALLGEVEATPLLTKEGLGEVDASAHSPDEWEQWAQWLTALLELRAAQAPRLDEIAARITTHEPAASLRTKRTLEMLRRAVTDCRTELLFAPEDMERVQAAVEKCVRLREELTGRGVRVSATSSWRGATTYSPWRVLDGRRDTSWLAADSAPLPQTLTLEFAEPRTISRLHLVQGTYHEAYNTRAYRVEVSEDGTTFKSVAEGEFANERGDERTHDFAPVAVRAVRIVITSVYPNVAYSSPSLAEVEVE